MSSKHFRKRRKKPRPYQTLLPATIMTSVTAFTCMFIFVLLSNQALGQLTSGSTVSHVNQYTNHEPSKSTTPLLRYGHLQVTRSNDQRPRHDSYLLQSNKLDENQEKRDRLLRKLSSTMLLETLLRKPSTTSNTNTREAPSIFLPHFSSLRPHRTIQEPVGNIRRSDVLRNETPALMMDVATTNLTQSISNSEREPNNEDAKTNTTSDSFNQRSLNYLVDKLLSLSGPNQGELSSAIPKIRPPTRAKPPVHQEHTLKLPYLDFKLSSSPQAPALTLDMLIKDEYDSRVQPMIESLKSQQNLSIASTTTKADSLNHRLDDVISGSEASTTASLLHQNATPSQDTIPSSMPPTHDKNATDESESDEYEDDDKSSTSPTDEDEDTEDGLKESTPKPKKILRNVPPYQLGSFTGRPAISTQIQHDNAFDNMQVRTTTTANTVSNDSLDPKSTDLKTASQQNVGAPDKSSEASTRGSLVFSDGGNEAERSNRRKEQSINQGARRNNTNKSLITPKNDKLGESFLLSQLFSTMNPLIDLNMKLNDQSVNIRDSNYHRNNHPLIYKGYVGKDDYLLSTTSSDWSRPIGNSRDNSTSNPFRHLYPSHYTTSTTTPMPPTEPPTVPYNYYLNQPVTNAQSVPPIFNPTTEATIELTPTTPTVIPTTHPRVQPTTRSPTILNFEHPSTVSDEESQTRVSNNRFPSNRKYSYQIPSNKQPSVVKPQISQRFPANNTRVQASRNVTSESELPEIKNISRPSQSGAKSHNSSLTGTSWSPTKVAQSETTTLMPPTTQEIQRKHQTPRKNHTSITLVSGANSSLPMMFPVVEAKGRPSSVANQENTDNAINSESDDGDDTPSVATSNKFAGRNTSDTDTSDGFSHAKPKFNAHRNKGGVSSGVDSDSAVNQSSDEQDDRDTRMQTNTDRKTKRPTANHHQKQRQPDDGHELKDESNNDYSNVNYNSKPMRKTGRPKNRIQSLEEDDGEISNSSPNNETLHQQAKKVNKFINHEPAGSEISESGVDNRLSDVNHTNRFVHFHQPTRTTESIMVGGNSVSDTPGGHPVDSLKIPIGGAGSAVHPNPNFYGEASSERPVMDNSFSMFGGPIAPHRNNNHHHMDTSRDPYQRTSSNTVLSTVQHPGSSTLAPSTSSSNLPPSTSTTQISTTNKESLDESGTRQTGDGAKAANKSSDRLAFILIGGSCVLSVVCLVLAAMSMRCQDMCDDYQSLRNAEKAALKLQKHRLKYTKNHQINRLNHGLSSSDSGQNLIDDFNSDNNRINNTSSAEIDLNQARNLRFQTNAKSIQFMDSALGKGQPHWNQAAVNGGVQPASVVNGNNHHVHRIDSDGVHQICGCENCTDRRMLLHEDLVLSNKHLSWLHPYYQMQHPSRFRPLFGAGSSVGTFFPQMHAERSFRGASSGGAQVLMDANNNRVGAHRSCGMARSKSFLSRGNNVPKHARSNHLDHSACGAAHLDCGNLDHNHAQHHICHNNHHEHSSHKCHHTTGETTASDESELTIDEGHCENHAHCAREQARDELNNRVKLIQMSKLNSQLSSGYKKQLASQVKRTSHSHHNNHSHHNHNHHHHQHLTASSSDSSSLPQCTCTRDHQPLMAHVGRPHKSGHKHHGTKHDPRSSARQQAKRDKSMLIWSTNRDRLI